MMSTKVAFYIRRLAASLTDVTVNLLLVYLWFKILPIVEHRDAVLGVTLLALFLLKDSYQGASFGKRLFRLQVVSIDTHREVSVLKCFIRNLTLLLLPIEMVWIVVYPNRRLGDFLAETEVSDTCFSNQQTIPSFLGELLLPLLLCFFLCLGVAVTIMSDEKEQLPVCHFPYEESLNITESDQLCEMLSTEFSRYVGSSEVLVYDSTEQDSVPYVSTILYLSKDHPSLQHLSENLQLLVSQHLDSQHFILYCEFVVIGQQHVSYSDYYLDNRYK